MLQTVPMMFSSRTLLQEKLPGLHTGIKVSDFAEGGTTVLSLNCVLALDRVQLNCVFVFWQSATENNYRGYPILGNSSLWQYPPHCTKQQVSVVIRIPAQPTVAETGLFWDLAPVHLLRLPTLNQACSISHHSGGASKYQVKHLYFTSPLCHVSTFWRLRAISSRNAVSLMFAEVKQRQNIDG